MIIIIMLLYGPTPEGDWGLSFCGKFIAVFLA
jgi:hypothetical protein